MKKRVAALVPLLMCVFALTGPAPAWAQEAPADVAAGDETAGQHGQTLSIAASRSETVGEMMEREALLPVGALRMAPAVAPRARLAKRTDVATPEVAQWPPSSARPEALAPLPLAPQTPGTDFLATQLSESGFIPAQPSGAVSPTQVLVAAANRIKLFDKNGTLGVLNASAGTFFGTTANVSDVHVRYDRLSQRWFLSAIDVATPLACPNHVLVAVSDSSVITASTVFSIFTFTVEVGRFQLQPSLGVDRNAVYIGTISATDTTLGCATNAADQSTAIVLNKASLFTPTATGTVFSNLIGATGMVAPQGVDNDDPASTQGYFIDVDAIAFNRLVLRRISTPGGTPTISADILLTVPTTRSPINQVQPAPNAALSANDDRLFSAAIRRDKIGGTTALWTAHNIGTNPSCVGATGANIRNSSRWYEIRNLAATPTLTQSGTLCDNAGTGPFGFWIPSVSASGQGHMALGSSRASTNATTGFASVVAAGRLRTDALNTTQAAAVVVQSTFGYNLTAAPQPWGGYSQTVVDPADDQSMWTFQEYANATNSWGVRATRLLAPLPAQPSSATPASVFEGQPSLNVTLTGTSAAGTEFFDPGADTGGPGYPNHISTAISGGVTVNSTTFTSTTQVTLNISTVGAAPGAKDVTVTNPDGQTRTGVGVLTVLACPVININPPTVPGATVGSAYLQVFSQTGGVAPATFGLSGTLPSGMTFTAATATLSGTPTQIGSFNFTVSTRDTNGCPGTRDYTLVVSCQTITVDPPTIPAATAGTSYTQQFTQTGAIGTVTWSLTGTLPTGMSFDTATGVLLGTPLQTGPFPITVTATDGNTCGGSQAYTLVVNCQTITVGPGTIPNATAGTAYSQAFNQTGGIGTVTWSIAGALPSGMSFNTATGVLSGTPLQTGSFPLTVTASDGNACTGSVSVTLTVDCQTITVSPGTIPAATAGSSYTQTFTQTSGIGTVTWSVTGTLPTGMSFNTSTGVLSGTPLQTGSFPLTVTATDGNNCTGSVSVTLVVNCQTITVSPGTIPAGTAGTAYSQAFTQTSGIGTVTWSVAGTLPTGMSLDTATGVLSGTPLQTGSFPITVTATDGNNCTGSVSVTLVVNCQAIGVNPATIPGGQPNTPYSQFFTQTNGIGTVTWSETGALPSGFTLNPATGELSGTTTDIGSFPIAVTATDGNLCTGARTYNLTIGCNIIAVDPTTIPSGTAGVAYTQTFTQTGGSGTVTFALTGTLPNGLTFDAASATLSGTPTQTGSFPITVSVTDGIGCPGSRDYTLVINCATVTVNPTTIPAATAGSAFTQTFTQTGGLGAVTWSLTGALPAGLTFDTATGVLSGTPTQTGSFPITVTASDGNACTGSRDYTLVVNRAAPFASTTLAADTGGNGVFEAGEIAIVAPTWRNDTGAPDTVTGTASNFTGPVAVAFGGTTYTITDATADYGAVAAGATASCSGTGNCYGFEVSNPRPTLHWDGTFTETLSNGDAKQWTLHVGDSFDDVVRSNQYYRFVETLLHRGVTGGCGASTYCPNDSSRREQMAVFVLVAKEGPGYTPAACTTPLFSDVPANSPYCPYIEELSRRGVVNGCGGGKFCPLDPVSREQMAIFVLRTLDPALDPPACTTPVFNDVPASSPYCRWIEELARRNIVTGCGGGAYCPSSPVSRDQMSVFISATFGLTLYGQ